MGHPTSTRTTTPAGGATLAKTSCNRPPSPRYQTVPHGYFSLLCQTASTLEASASLARRWARGGKKAGGSDTPGNNTRHSAFPLLQSASSSVARRRNDFPFAGCRHRGVHHRLQPENGVMNIPASEPAGPGLYLRGGESTWLAGGRSTELEETFLTSPAVPHRLGAQTPRTTRKQSRLSESEAGLKSSCRFLVW